MKFKLLFLLSCTQYAPDLKKSVVGGTFVTEHIEHLCAARAQKERKEYFNISDEQDYKITLEKLEWRAELSSLMSNAELRDVILMNRDTFDRIYDSQFGQLLISRDPDIFAKVFSCKDSRNVISENLDRFQMISQYDEIVNTLLLNADYANSWEIIVSIVTQHGYKQLEKALSNDAERASFVNECQYSIHRKGISAFSDKMLGQFMRNGNLRKAFMRICCDDTRELSLKSFFTDSTVYNRITRYQSALKAVIENDAGILKYPNVLFDWIKHDGMREQLEKDPKSFDQVLIQRIIDIPKFAMRGKRYRDMLSPYHEILASQEGIVQIIADKEKQKDLLSLQVRLEQESTEHVLSLLPRLSKEVFERVIQYVKD